MEASFDFEPVPHGHGKRAERRPARAAFLWTPSPTCLYEQTRKEDVGGWVRDGNQERGHHLHIRDGSGDLPRHPHTDKKAGGALLHLHRKDTESGEWKDESDTTMKLTQARIERVLGMDCNTFCSVALIRQDAYGLFWRPAAIDGWKCFLPFLGSTSTAGSNPWRKRLPATSGSRMAATQERLSVLEETIATKGKLVEDLRQYDIQIAEANQEADRLDASIADAQRSASNAGEELQRQLSSRNAEINRTREEAAHKNRRARSIERAVHTGRGRGFRPQRGRGCCIRSQAATEESGGP